MAKLDGVSWFLLLLQADPSVIDPQRRNRVPNDRTAFW
jgi:hypothetical protein